MKINRLIHLSDLHIGKGKKEEKNLQRIINTLFARRNDQRYNETRVVITGDITDSGTQKQLIKAKHYINIINGIFPVYLVPGNHDHGWLGNFCQADAKGRWNDHLGGYFMIGGEDLSLKYDSAFKASFIGINTGDPHDKEISARGIVTKDQLADIDHCLMTTRYSDTIIVYFHHHPFTKKFFLKMRGANRLMKLLNSYPIDLILFGHHHNLGVWDHTSNYTARMISACQKTTEPISGNELSMSVFELFLDRAGQIQKIEMYLYPITGV